jgi:hypothetical protein
VSIKARVTATIVFGMAVAALSGCSSSPADEGGGVYVLSTASVYDGPVPSFTGPWAAQFEMSYRMTVSEVVHEILAKESITDADYAKVSSLFVDCMANRDFTVTIDGQDASFTVVNGTVQNQPAVDDALAACARPFDVVGGLRAQILRNPEHLDENEIVVACLVNSDLVEPGYSARDYGEEMRAERFSFDVNSAYVIDCLKNPLAVPGL